MKLKMESLITLSLYPVCFKKISGNLLKKYEARKNTVAEFVQDSQLQMFCADGEIKHLRGV